MNEKISRVCCAGLVVGVMSFSGLAVADGFRNPPNTAEALGKAGQEIVWGDAPSAVFYNPANLAAASRREVQVSSLAGYSHAEYRGLLGRNETVSPWCLLPSFAVIWPLPDEDAWTVGLGVHIPYGRQTRWDEDGPLRFRFLSPVLSRLMVVDLAPAIAWRASDSVSIGAGMDFYYGQLQLRQLMPLPGGRISADAEGLAVGGHAGVTWSITPRQRLALTCRAPFDMNFDGTLKTRHILLPSVPESDFSTRFRFPTIIALGYGVQLSESVRIEANVEWLQFSRYTHMPIDAGANNVLVRVLGLADTPLKWNDTWTFGLAADWRFAPGWTARGGYILLQSPIPDRTFAPSMLDVDQSMAGVGLGYRTGRHAVDCAGAVGLFNTRRIRSNQSIAYRRGTYAFEGYLAALSYTWSF